MESAEIKAELQALDITYSILADASGFNRSYIGAVITRHSTSLPVAKVVAKAISKPVRQVFPELFKREEKQQKRDSQVDALRQRLAS